MKTFPPLWTITSEPSEYNHYDVATWKLAHTSQLKCDLIDSQMDKKRVAHFKTETKTASKDKIQANKYSQTKS